jgi:dihydropteroate synthase
MGIVNVTPDSFSDGGRYLGAEAAIAHGRRLLDEGADILDVGGESTRPGAAPVPVEEELSRVLPVIEALAADGALVSVDTRHAVVMARAAEAGASIINDVTALEGEGAMETAAGLELPVILMHMQGEPSTMQDAPAYDDVIGEVRAYLSARVAACEAAGIARADICVDPGIGFGKTLAHNAALLAHLDEVAPPDIPLLLGASRKSFIAYASQGEPADLRLAGSIAAALLGAARGAAFLRVHDVAATAQALAVQRAVFDAR